MKILAFSGYGSFYIKPAAAAKFGYEDPYEIKRTDFRLIKLFENDPLELVDYPADFRVVVVPDESDWIIVASDDGYEEVYWSRATIHRAVEAK